MLCTDVPAPELFMQDSMNSTGLVSHWYAGHSEVTAPMLVLETVTQHFCPLSVCSGERPQS